MKRKKAAQRVSLDVRERPEVWQWLLVALLPYFEAALDFIAKWRGFN